MADHAQMVFTLGPVTCAGGPILRQGALAGAEAIPFSGCVTMGGLGYGRLGQLLPQPRDARARSGRAPHCTTCRRNLGGITTVHAGIAL